MQKTQNFIHLELNISTSVNGMMPSTDKMKIICLNSIEDDEDSDTGKRPLQKNQLFLKLLYQKKGVISILMKAPVGISLLI